MLGGQRIISANAGCTKLPIKTPKNRNSFMDEIPALHSDLVLGGKLFHKNITHAKHIKYRIMNVS